MASVPELRDKVAMKAIYYNIFGLGHINPTLPLVEALVRGGVEVIYHTSPIRQTLVESAGARFRHYGRDDYKAADYNPGKNFVLQTIPAAAGLLPFLLEEIDQEKPDFILYDSMAPWGKIIGQITGLPAFCTVTTFALNESLRLETFAKHNVETDEVNLAVIAALKEQFKIDLPLTNALGAYGECNFVFTAKAFNPALTGLDPEHFHFVGTLLPETKQTDNFPFERPTNRKVITMALGTIIPQEDPTVVEWYRSFLRAFGTDDRFTLVVATGTSEILEALGPAPRNTIIRERIPQPAVLRETAVFINHGGMNSINEGLSMGIPMVVIPHSYDQFVNAARVEELKLGKVIRKQDVTAAHIKSAVLEMLFSTQHKKNCLAMRDQFAQTIGLSGVLSVIEEHLQA